MGAANRRHLIGAACLAGSLAAACAKAPDSMHENFEMIATDQFRFVSTATMMHPINSRQGEQFRLARLAEQLRQRNACPAGYSIAARDPPLFFNNDSRFEYAVRDVTYIGRCKG